MRALARRLSIPVASGRFSAPGGHFQEWPFPADRTDPTTSSGKEVGPVVGRICASAPSRPGPAAAPTGPVRERQVSQQLPVRDKRVQPVQAGLGELRMPAGEVGQGPASRHHRTRLAARHAASLLVPGPAGSWPGRFRQFGCPPGGRSCPGNRWREGADCGSLPGHASRYRQPARGPGRAAPQVLRGQAAPARAHRGCCPQAPPCRRSVSLPSATARPDHRPAGSGRAGGGGETAPPAGQGTFVAKPKVAQVLELTSYTEDMRAHGLHPGP